jgi:hypothetical protein
VLTVTIALANRLNDRARVDRLVNVKKANLPEDCAQELVNQIMYPKAEKTPNDEELGGHPW